MSSYRRILGVGASANKAEIKKAFRKMAIQWHPDKHQTNKAAAEKKFKEISEAYDSLMKGIEGPASFGSGARGDAQRRSSSSSSSWNHQQWHSDAQQAWQREWQRQQREYQQQRAQWTQYSGREKSDRAWDEGGYYGESEQEARERRARARYDRQHGGGSHRYEDFFHDEQERQKEDEKRAASMLAFAGGVGFACIAAYQVVSSTSRAVRERNGDFVDAWYNPVTERWEVPYESMRDDPDHMVNRKKLLRRMPSDMVFDPNKGDFAGDGRGIVPTPHNRGVKRTGM